MSRQRCGGALATEIIDAMRGLVCGLVVSKDRFCQYSVSKVRCNQICCGME